MRNFSLRLRRLTSQERAELIGRYRISGLTQKQFAEENQIRPAGRTPTKRNPASNIARQVIGTNRTTISDSFDSFVSFG